MRTRNRISVVVNMLAGITILILSVGDGSAITGDEIIDRMRQSFAKHKTFSVRFEKDFYWALLDTRPETRKGRIFTRRPDQFRVELDNGDLIVASGDGIWNYSSQNQQVVVGDYDGELKTPWEILLDYSHSYKPLAVTKAELEGEACYELTLAPQVSEAQIAQIKVWIGLKKWHLLQVEKVEVTDDITTYRLTDHRTNKKLDDALFVYDIPDGIQLIDRRGSIPADER